VRGHSTPSRTFLVGNQTTGVLGTCPSIPITVNFPLCYYPYTPEPQQILLQAPTVNPSYLCWTFVGPHSAILRQQPPPPSITSCSQLCRDVAGRLYSGEGVVYSSSLLHHSKRHTVQTIHSGYGHPLTHWAALPGTFRKRITNIRDPGGYLK
jgi:hypothetical protein